MRRRAKPLRDYLTRQVFAQCADLALPIQIHTGFGDSDIRLADANPVLLDDVLRSPEGAAANTVLIHAGYPWHEQLAYLTLVRHNVWAEFSLVNLFSPAHDRRPAAAADRRRAGRPRAVRHGRARRAGDPLVRRLRCCATRGARWRRGCRRRPARSWVDRAARLMFHDNAARLYPGVADLIADGPAR